MRVNVYSQELTSEVKHVEKVSDGSRVVGQPCYPNGQPNLTLPREPLPGFLVEFWEKNGQPDFVDATNPYRDVHREFITYHAAQLILHSSPMLHHPPRDDDRSAITFWLPKSSSRREEMARAFEEIAKIFRAAPPDTGLD